MFKATLLTMLLLAGCQQATKPCEQQQAKQVPMMAEKNCTWETVPIRSEIYKEKWRCISLNGAIRGSVYQYDYREPISEWSAYFNGGYCDNGASFVSREAAMRCVNKAAGN